MLLLECIYLLSNLITHAQNLYDSFLYSETERNNNFISYYLNSIFHFFATRDVTSAKTVFDNNSSQFLGSVDKFFLEIHKEGTS